MIKGFVWLKKRSLITHHLIFVIHYSSLKIPKLLTLHPFGTITQLVITQNFQQFVSPITVTWCSFYLFFFLQPPMPKLTELSVKKKNQWKGKEKKEDEETKLTEPSEKKKKKKKKRVKSCGWLWPWDPVCSFNYVNVIENRVMETENI